MEEISEEPAELVERVAALDIGKAILVACARVPQESKAGRRRQEVRTFATTTRSLLGLADWLDGLGVTRVVMEATSTYWKPPFYLLEESCACWLVNAREVKHVPGRPKTDTQDAVWLAKLAERGMLRPSLVPPPWQRELRDLTRYRRTLIHERTRENQPVEKLLEDTQIKLSAVVSDMFGVSGRQLLEALIAGQRDPKVLAQLAQGRMRSKLGVLEEALTGHFRAHHGYLLRMMLDRIDALGAQADQLTGRIEELLAPLPIRWSSWMRSPAWAGSARRSSSPRSAWSWVAFPAPGTWCRGPSSPPRPTPRPARPSPAPPARATPGSAAHRGGGDGSLQDQDLPLGARYRRIVKRRGKQRALVAVGNPGPHHRLPPAIGPAGPLRRPRRRLPRPLPPRTPNPSTDPRTRTPLRQEGHPPHGRLHHSRHPAPSQPHPANTSPAPPGAPACPLTNRFSIQPATGRVGSAGTQTGSPPSAVSDCRTALGVSAVRTAMRRLPCRLRCRGYEGAACARSTQERNGQGVGVSRDGTFEGALSATEAQVAATMQSAAALTRELKRVKAGSASGQTRELRRALEAAETLAAQLAEAARSLRAGYDFDEQAYLASGAYAKELLATAATAGVDMFEEDERLLCYPSLVRILSDPAAVEIDRKRERRLRPSVVVAVLAAAQRRGPRFRPEPFLDSLRTAYELVVARDGKKRDAVVRLTDIWAVLTVLPGQGREYTKQEFARDLYLLDQSGLTTTSRTSRRLRWSASTGTKGAGVLTTVTRGGQQRRYWGIAFSPPSQGGGAGLGGDFGSEAAGSPTAGG